MTVRIIVGDARERLADLSDESIDCIVTSPPYYGLRDYGAAGQIGTEETPDAYVDAMVGLFNAARRVLRPTGTFWLNLGDSYAAGGHGGGGRLSGVNRSWSKAEKENRGWRPPPAGFKAKDLLGIPWRVAMALQEDGWWLRSAIIWAKPNAMPNSQEDRPTSSYETVFMLARSESYWSDFDAIKTPPRESTMIRTAQDTQAQAGSHRAHSGAKTMKAVGGGAKTDKQRGHSRRHAGFNDRWDAKPKEEQQAKPAMIRDVWFISPANYSGGHYAVMPEELARRCILAGCPEGGTVLDPFGGAGTTGLVADRLRRDAVLIEINPAYAAEARRRIADDAGWAADVSIAEERAVAPTLL